MKMKPMAADFCFFFIAGVKIVFLWFFKNKAEGELLMMSKIYFKRKDAKFITEMLHKLRAQRRFTQQKENLRR